MNSIPWLPWTQRAAQLGHTLLAPSHAGYASLTSILLRHGVSPLLLLWLVRGVGRGWDGGGEGQKDKGPGLWFLA